MAARLKTSVARTRQDEESRKELLAGISHDLRSPLTSIRAYVEGLLDGVAKTPEARQRYLLTIKAKAEDIDRMVSQLFLFSKLDMAEYPMEPRTLRLDEFCHGFGRGDSGRIPKERPRGHSGAHLSSHGHRGPGRCCAGC